MLDLIPGLDVSPLAQALLDASHTLRWVNSAWTALCQRHPATGELWPDQVDEASLREELPHLADLIAGTIEAYSCMSRLYVGSRTDASVHRPTISVVLQVRRLAPELILVAAFIAASEPHRVPLHALTSQIQYDDEVNLAAVVGHDFRQHARLITAYVSLIKRQTEPGLTPQMRKHVTTIEHHAMRLNGLFVDLVRWLRLGHETKVRLPCRITELWHAAQADQASLLSARPAFITHDEQLPTLLGDPELLVVVFIELLRNAVLYHGEKIPRVHLSAMKEDTLWCLLISDQGPGMSAAECMRAPKLFQRFHNWEHIPGNGMGLAIVHKIIVQHGGDLSLRSRPGISGCQVQVRLPG